MTDLEAESRRRRFEQMLRAVEEESDLLGPIAVDSVLAEIDTIIDEAENIP